MMRKPDERAMDIYRRRQAGETFVSIARDYPVTAGRVNEIFRETVRKLRWIARETNTCPICNQGLPPIVDASELTASA